MKTFTAFLNELYANDHIAKDEPYSPALGKEVPSDAKHIGTLKNGDRIFHRSIKTPYGQPSFGHHYYVVGKSGKTNIHLETNQPDGEVGENIRMVSANKESRGAHHLYQHLVLKHNKILVTGEQTQGGRTIWQRAAKHPKINIHGWDEFTEKPFHAKPDEDEHYVHPRDLNDIDAEREAAFKAGHDTIPYHAEKQLLQKGGMFDKLVMHKK